MSFEIFKDTAKRGHEQVTFFYDAHTNLKAIVAIHSTVLGPSLGGCRMKPYQSESEAIDDVLRLAEGMTYKSAVAGLDLGGGKACIIGDHTIQEGREALFRRFGECVKSLGGRYITAEDMGTTVDDIMAVQEVCPHVSGTSFENGGGGDPSPWTARGVFEGIVAAIERESGSKDITGRKIAIQGVGHVGRYLTELLTKAGAKVVATDLSRAQLEYVKSEYGAEIVEQDQIYDVPCDVYSPCAVGQTVNRETIGRLKCRIIAGGANNQIKEPSLYTEILERKLLYCPDFVINAGGVINCASEIQPGGWSERWTAEKVAKIYHTIHAVLERAEREGTFPETVAIAMAKERIAKARAGQ